MNNYIKTVSSRFDENDINNIETIKMFWENEDNKKYSYSDIIRICLEIICQAEYETRNKSNKSDT